MAEYSMAQIIIMATLTLGIGATGTYFVIDNGSSVDFYTVNNTGVELTCATGTGWTIDANHSGYVDASCRYVTKAWNVQKCSETFRSTAKYPTYGCNVVEVNFKGSINKTFEEPIKNETIINSISKDTFYQNSDVPLSEVCETNKYDCSGPDACICIR